MTAYLEYSHVLERRNEDVAETDDLLYLSRMALPPLLGDQHSRAVSA